MTLIPQQQGPTPEQMFERLQTWWQQQQQLAKLRALEILKRKEMVAYYFVDPRQGTNRLDVGGGFDLKLDVPFKPKVDEAMFKAVKTADFTALGIDKATLFPLKPTLSVTAYRKLNDKQRAFIDQMLDVGDNTPQLHIVARSQDEQVSTEVQATTAPAKRATRKAAAKAPTKKAVAKKVAPKPPRKR